MASCEKYTDLISARLDGMITPEEERELEAHLAGCPACRELAQQTAALHAAFPALEEIPAPEGFARGVMEKIRAEKPKKKVLPLTERPQFKVFAGMAACLVLCMALSQSGMGGRKSAALDSAADMANCGSMRSAGKESEGILKDTLALKCLPRGSGIMLADALWKPDGEGNSVCTVSADGMEQLLDLVQEQKLPVEELPDRPLIKGGTYWVILLQDN